MISQPVSVLPLPLASDAGIERKYFTLLPSIADTHVIEDDLKYRLNKCAFDSPRRVSVNFAHCLSRQLAVYIIVGVNPRLPLIALEGIESQSRKREFQKLNRDAGTFVKFVLRDSLHRVIWQDTIGYIRVRRITFAH